MKAFKKIIVIIFGVWSWLCTLSGAAAFCLYAEVDTGRPTDIWIILLTAPTIYFILNGVWSLFEDINDG